MSTAVLIRERVGRRVPAWASEFAGFGAVGAVGYATDLVVFNLLCYLGDPGLLADRPVTAKLISSGVGLLVTYLGNRHWTWRCRPSTCRHREVMLFVLFNLIGLAIALGCLGVSHHVLGFTSPLADNIAANIVGVSLGGLFRFWTYRTYVFQPVPAAA
ncbi:GtrA family protein [Nocardioidaceae bacterium SCSIO 66511]|nr:GtrA family protein [Nocardioidaceae bacterium SCSIO 66511]